jgi:hypothetical protein
LRIGCEQHDRRRDTSPFAVRLPHFIGMGGSPATFHRHGRFAMLAAGRASADIARIFRVHRATASRIAGCDGLY